MVIIADCKRAIHFEFFLDIKKSSAHQPWKDKHAYLCSHAVPRCTRQGDHVNRETEIVVRYPRILDTWQDEVMATRQKPD